MENLDNAATAGEDAPPEVKPKPLYRLTLDHDGVYWGAVIVDADGFKDDDVILDHAPDNPPGRYKWNAAEQRLDALPASQVKSAPEAPTLEQAFHHLVMSLDEAGHVLPVVVRAWAAEFKRTFDELTK